MTSKLYAHSNTEYSHRITHRWREKKILRAPNTPHDKPSSANIRTHKCLSVYLCCLLSTIESRPMIPNNESYGRYPYRRQIVYRSRQLIYCCVPCRVNARNMLTNNKMCVCFALCLCAIERIFLNHYHHTPSKSHIINYYLKSHSPHMITEYDGGKTDAANQIE